MKPPTLVELDLTEVTPKEAESDFLSALIGGGSCVVFLAELAVIFAAIAAWRGHR